ncbi:unnamed protein product, partial [Tilletia controversa]
NPVDPTSDDDPGAGGDEAATGDGTPCCRLDWVNGQINDERFSEVLDDLSQELVEQPDDYGLPKEDAKRTFRYVRAACKRTLEEIRRQARLLHTKTAAELEEMTKNKKTVDRRRVRQKARTNSRKNAALQNPLRFGDAERAMLTRAGVEWDETDYEYETDEEAEPEKVSRVIWPEWFSEENRQVQNKAHKEVPSHRLSYKVVTARHLTAYTSTKPLSGKLMRIQVSSTFAQKYPKLVRSVKKNLPPFKPARGGVADSEEQWGTPIVDLDVL